MSFSNSEVAHRFATGLNGRSGNMFIEGDAIYSYGHHFKIAEKYHGKLLFTEQTYSSTTAMHKSRVLGACSHYDIVYCATLDSGDVGTERFFAENFKLWNEDIACKARAMAKARKPKKYLAEIHKIILKVSAFCELFGKELPEEFKKWNNESEVSEVLEFLKREEEAKRQREEAARKKAEEDFKNFKIHWVSGEHQILRFRAEKNRFETSKGVQVPFEVARTFYERLKAGLVEIGDKLLCYTVRGVGKELKIGCHTFKTSYLLDYGKEFFK